MCTYHIDIEKTWLLARDSVFLTNMNTNIDHTVKENAPCLEYQHIQPQERALHYKIPCRPWEVVRPDKFMVNNKTLQCTVDYYSKFPIVKKVGSLSADDLV